MRARSILGLLAGLPGLLLAACDGEAPTTVVHFKRADLLDSYLAYASREGPVLTVIHGVPFAGRDADTRRITLDAFARTVTWRKAAFTDTRADAIRPDYRVVLAFNAPAATDARALCRGEAPGGGGAAAETTVRAVFCAKDDLVSDVSGRFKGAAGPEDKLFVKLVEQVARDLLDHR